MKILFLCNIHLLAREMYRDLIDEFVSQGHEAYVICPAEESSQKGVHYKWHIIDGIHVYYVQHKYITGNSNVIKKALSCFTSDDSLVSGIKKCNIEEVGIDLILYSTPPITMTRSIALAKKSTKARTFLMLKDIFPQNAVDLEMMKSQGSLSLQYRFFRAIERKLYRLSDYIGCMSQGNINYLLSNNVNVYKEKVGLCVNSYAVKPLPSITRTEVLAKYGINTNKLVYVYGGNLGKPQCIDFVVSVLRENEESRCSYFVICGKGSEDYRIRQYIDSNHPKNVCFINGLPSDLFVELTMACDIGLIFLDNRFTIPNFPSRILTYMQTSKPVLAITDRCTDIAKIITSEGFGWWHESCNPKSIKRLMDSIADNAGILQQMGEKSHRYYIDNYLPSNTYQQIMELLE